MKPLFEPGKQPARTEIRKKIDNEFGGKVVIVRYSRNTKKTLHAPAPGETIQSMCGCSIEGEWQTVEMAVYPLGNKNWCKRCLARLYPDRSTREGVRQ